MRSLCFCTTMLGTKWVTAVSEFEINFLDSSPDFMPPGEDEVARYYSGAAPEVEAVRNVRYVIMEGGRRVRVYYEIDLWRPWDHEMALAFLGKPNGIGGSRMHVVMPSAWADIR